MQIVCFQCHHKIEIGERVGRRDDCSQCGADLHVCRNCQHYDLKSYNECRESQADRVLEKDKSNFCDYFVPVTEGKGPQTSPAQDAKARLEQLFKKK